MKGALFQKISNLLIAHQFIPVMGVKQKRCGNHEVETIDADLTAFPANVERRRFSALQFRNQRHELVVLMKDPKRRARLVCEYPVSTEYHVARARRAAAQNPTLAKHPSITEVKSKLEALLALDA